MASARYQGLKNCARLGVLAWLMIIAACDRSSIQTSGTVEDQQVVQDFLQLHRTLRADKAGNLIKASNAFASVTQDFLASPRESGRLAWQRAWITLHETWLEYAYVTPNTTPNTGNVLVALTHRIESASLQVGFIDSLPEYPHSGIVNDLALTLSRETIDAQHAITSNDEIALGLHPLEYYIFARPLADFSAPAENADRRLTYVTEIAVILREDINEHVALTALLEEETPLSSSQVVAMLRERQQRIFRETDLDNHGRFSGTQRRAAEVQMRVLARLIEDTRGLGVLLKKLDATLATDLSNNTREAVALLGTERSDENTQRLLLLIAAVGHQLEDVERLLFAPAD